MGPAVARRRAADERGAAMPIIALVASVLVLSISLAVDLGRLVSTTRDLQKVADLASLDALREVDTTSTTAVLQTAVDAAADASALRNGFGSQPSEAVTAVLGTWDQATETFTPTSAGQVPDAVEVTVATTLERAFQVGSDSPSRSAIAKRFSTAAISVGSRLSIVDSTQADLLNDVLNDAFGTGTSIGLSAADHTALAGADVSLGQLATQLGVGGPTEVLTSVTNVDDFLLAAADALDAEGDPATAAILDALAAIVPVVPLDLTDVIDLDPQAEDLASDADLNIAGMLQAIAFVTDGDNFINLPSLTVAVPGVTTATGSLTLVEGARVLFGPEGVSVSTAQVRLNVDPTLSLAVPGIPAGTMAGTATVRVELGGLTATIDAIECDSDPRLFVEADPGTAATTMTMDVIVSGQVGLVTVPVLDLEASASASTSNPPTLLSWDHPGEIGVTKSVGSTTVGLGATGWTATSTTILAGPPIPLPNMLTAVFSAIAPVMTEIDNEVVQEISELVGMRWGGGDITMLDVDCDAPRLAA